MSYSTLIDTETLSSIASHRDLVVVDCRFDLKDTERGERAYAAGHIPGAVYAHLDRDLSGTETGRNGRHPLPDPATLAETFGRLGIHNAAQVVAYDQDTGMFASRLWWMLRWMGHDAVAVLDGGFAKWTREGRPIVERIETRPRQRFVPSPRPEMLVSAEQVDDLKARGFQLLDARAPERFRGDLEPLDRVPGHIPGARNHFYQTNLSEQGTFKPPRELANALTDTTPDVDAAHIVSYCGSGVTACHNLLALEHAGLHGAKLYAGSWSEWCADPEREVEKGA